MFKKDLLVELRKNLKISQQELSDLSGIPKGTIGAIEAGNAVEPKPSSIKPIAKVLKVDWNLFYADDDCSMNQAAS